MTDRDERILDARIALGKVVNFSFDGWQSRYCAAVDRIALYYRVESYELSAAFMEYYGASLD